MVSTRSTRRRDVKEVAASVKEEVKRELTVLWDQLPSWQQDNHYILRGYRPASGSYWKSASSLGYLHNESVNIYSHLVPAIVFACGGVFAYMSLRPRYEAASTQDIYAFACFFVGATTCLGMSATYHTISNHSPMVAQLGNKLDYLGIVALIWGSFVPSIYYGFTCDSKLFRTYLGMITLMSAGCAIVSSKSIFRTPEWRPFRAGMFIALGLSAVLPVIHGVARYGVDRLWPMMALPYVVTQGVLYVLGATLYAARVPERFKPGFFDIWGHSHQIFHVLVVIAAVVHLVGLIHAFDYRHSKPKFLLCAGLGA